MAEMRAAVDLRCGDLVTVGEDGKVWPVSAEPRPPLQVHEELRREGWIVATAERLLVGILSADVGGDWAPNAAADHAFQCAEAFERKRMDRRAEIEGAK